MRWLSRQSTFKVGKRKTENVRWFSIRIFPFVKLGIGSRAYPLPPAGGARGRPVDESSASSIHFDKKQIPLTAPAFPKMGPIPDAPRLVAAPATPSCRHTD